MRRLPGDEMTPPGNVAVAQSVPKTFDAYLESLGFRLGRTIGTGSYAKVKIGEYTSRAAALLSQLPAPNSSGAPTGGLHASPPLARSFAAKIIDRRRAQGDFLHKFLPRELEILLRLHHPHIIQVYEILEVQHRIYIFMELAEGGDLLDYIKLRGFLCESTAQRMFGELAQAVEYCHGLQIAHRDLKCENVLLDRAAHVKLADFGFSRTCGANPATGRRSLSRTYCGSAAYAAPEILQGVPYNPKLYDIWSLGCILYIMLHGLMPFIDADIPAMIREQLARRVRFVTRTTVTLPRAGNSNRSCSSCDTNEQRQQQQQQQRPTEVALDPSVIQLIRQMLEPDVTRRANIHQVLRHAWLQIRRATLT